MIKRRVNARRPAEHFGRSVFGRDVQIARFGVVFFPKPFRFFKNFIGGGKVFFGYPFRRFRQAQFVRRCDGDVM